MELVRAAGHLANQLLRFEVVAANRTHVLAHALVCPSYLDVRQLSMSKRLSVCDFRVVVVASDCAVALELVFVAEEPDEERVVVFFVVERLNQEPTPRLLHLHSQSNITYPLEGDCARNDRVDVSQKPPDAQTQDHCPRVRVCRVLAQVKSKHLRSPGAG